MEKKDDHLTLVLTGTWLYDGTVKRKIEIYSYPAEFACSRYDYDIDDYDESIPIPETENGCLYCVVSSQGADFPSLEEAMVWADQQPWGPVKWDREPENE